MPWIRSANKPAATDPTMNSLHLSLFGAGVTAIVLGIYDKKTGFMPNLLTVGSLLMAFVIRPLAEGTPGALSAFLGMFVVAAPPAILFFKTRGEAVGGGDVKALAALGAWLGPQLGLEVELLSFCLLAGSTLLVQAKTGQLLPFLGRSFRLLIPKILQKDAAPPVPIMTYVRFGPFLATGTIIACGAAVIPADVSFFLALVS